MPRRPPGFGLTLDTSSDSDHSFRTFQTRLHKACSHEIPEWTPETAQTTGLTISSKILGSGANAIVMEGKFQGNRVAVKESPIQIG